MIDGSASEGTDLLKTVVRHIMAIWIVATGHPTVPLHDGGAPGSVPPHNRASHAVRFRFQGGVLHDRNAAAIRIEHPAGALLNYMAEFVGEQLLPVRSMGVVVAGREMDIGSPGEGDGADGSYLGPT